VTDRADAVVRILHAMFERTADAAGHFAIVDDPLRRAQIMWVRRHRKDLWETLRPGIMASWERLLPGRREELRAASRRSVAA
jgi:hypothetical protein